MTMSKPSLLDVVKAVGFVGVIAICGWLIRVGQTKQVIISTDLKVKELDTRVETLETDRTAMKTKLEDISKQMDTTQGDIKFLIRKMK